MKNPIWIPLVIGVLIAWAGFAQSIVPNPIGTPVFSGSGLNDFSAGGQFIGSLNVTYTVTINSTVTKFNWAATDGGSGTAINITGGTCAAPYTAGNGWQALSHGFAVCWLASAGHTAGNNWTIKVTANGTVAQSSFMPPGLGVPVRSAQSKLRDLVSITDFGAVGDGVTDNLAALTAAAASGFNLYCPAGIGGHRDQFAPPTGAHRSCRSANPTAP